MNKNFCFGHYLALGAPTQAFSGKTVIQTKKTPWRAECYAEFIARACKMLYNLLGGGEREKKRYLKKIHRKGEKDKEF